MNNNSYKHCDTENACTIDKITFHTVRHFKATMEYYKTKDSLYLMKALGHKNINNILCSAGRLPRRHYVVKVAENVE